MSAKPKTDETVLTPDQRPHDVSQPLDKLDPVEKIKADGNYLRGTIKQSLEDRLTYAVRDNDTKTLKFFGIYQQDDRDIRDERRHQKLEPAYSFMVRLRIPGGVITPKQWLKLDELARTHANGTLRITDRQTFQYHGVLKPNLKSLMQGFRDVGLDCIAACGDVNRGVLAAPNTHLSTVHADVYAIACAVSNHLRPQTSAYAEIWYDEKPTGPDEEPLYGPTYLPRKFKIAFAVPPSNDVDVYAHDIGFVAIEEKGKLAGFNVLVGGGMGRTDNANQTYPRLGSLIGFIPPDRVTDVAEKTVTIQRDYGDRVNRAHARFKYTLDDRGLDWFKNELHQRLGYTLDAPRPFSFDNNTDRFGWVQSDDGLWHYTLFVLTGRIKDDAGTRVMSALRAIAGQHTGEFRLTPNQNVIISKVAGKDKAIIEALLAEHHLGEANEISFRQKAAIACVALPTCGLAMAEAERYLPSLIDKIDRLLEKTGLSDQPITIRMTGCPNGCGRPYIAELGFSGRAPGKYNMYLGGGAHGQRLNKLYRENIGEEQILEELTMLFTRYAAERAPGEPFGDYVIRAGFVPEVKEGRFFND